MIFEIIYKKRRRRSKHIQALLPFYLLRNNILNTKIQENKFTQRKASKRPKDPFRFVIFGV
jgi:hypothetical protein